MSSVQGNIYQSDQKFGDSKDGYIGSILSHINRLVETISRPELGSAIVNIQGVVNTIINHIPDKDMRKDLKKSLKQRTKEMKEEKAKEKGIEVSKLSPEEIKQITLIAETDSIGEVFDILDNVLGIIKENRISFDKECSECKYKKKIIELHPEMV